MSSDDVCVAFLAYQLYSELHFLRIALNMRTFGFISKKAVDLHYGTIEDCDSKFVIGHIQNQVLAHDGQTDKSEISTEFDPRWSADIDAGQTGTTVSPLI